MWEEKTYIIAEGSNHNGDILLAKKLIDIAVKAKAVLLSFNFSKQTIFKKSDKLYKNLKKLELKKIGLKRQFNIQIKRLIFFLAYLIKIF